MTRRTGLLVLILLVVVGAVGVRFAPRFGDAAVLRPFDYMQYHSAGRAVLRGQNPYDGRVLYPLQKEIGTNWDDPVMMWNPPWTLPITLPLGAMHWRIGQLLWFAANFAAVAGSALLLWRSFGGPRDRRCRARFWIASQRSIRSLRLMSLPQSKRRGCSPIIFRPAAKSIRRSA